MTEWVFFVKKVQMNNNKHKLNNGGKKYQYQIAKLLF